MNKLKALELYKKYLTTKWPAWNDKNKLELPVEKKMYDKFISFDLSLENSKLLTEGLKKENTNGRLLFWSDPHFYHNNIIKYCNRPFDDMIDMNEKLVSYYKSEVTDNDIVVWTGDVSFSKAEKAANFLQNANLPGKKLLVLGNHDFEKYGLAYRDMKIFDEVSLCEGFTIELNINGENIEKDVLLTHYPVDKSILGNDLLNYHGHIHDKQIGLPYINLGVEVLGFKPRTAQECFDIAKNYIPTKQSNNGSYNKGI